MVGLLATAGGASDDPTASPSPTASIASQADVDAAVNKAVDQVTARWRDRLDAARAGAKQRVDRLKASSVAAQRRAVRTAVTEARAQERARAARTISQLRTQVSAAESSPAATSGGRGGLDPRFNYCYEANAAGYGPYFEGQDPEYAWYDDADNDGEVCE